MIIALINMVKSAPKHYIFIGLVIVGAGALSFVLPHITAECMALAGAPIAGEITRKRLNAKKVKGNGNRRHHSHVHYEMRQHGKPVNEMHGSE